MKTKTFQTIMLKTRYIVLAFMVAFSFSCSPEDGNDGAPGPEGPAGADGNANVISSDWFTASNETFVTNGYTSYVEFSIDVPELTTDVNSTGVVLVYFKPESFVSQVWPTGHIGMLPITISGGTTDHMFTYYTEASSIKIRYRQEGPLDTWTFSQSDSFRYVIIPSNNLKTGLDFTKMPYQKVVNHFGLKK